MKNKILLIILLLASGEMCAQNDSLAHYLEAAARNNPLVKSLFLTYEASLEKIPQAGAIPDPQIDMGFFLKPMEIIDGTQIADFKLMQMFPWFGTRRAARKEAAEMARMSYEQFRETKDNLFLEVKSAWYNLLSQQQRLLNIRENKILLVALKELATNRFAASSISSTTTIQSVPKIQETTAQPSPVAGGMGGMAQTTGNSPIQTNVSQSMEQMPGGGMGKNTQGNLSDVLRIDMELNELENEEQAVISLITSARAKFNSLLRRPVSTEIILPDSIVQQTFSPDNDFIIETIRRQNPMLAMANAEANAYKAKLEMDKKMGLPMIGIGIQYSLIGKRMDMGIPITGMNGKDMVMPMVSVSIPIYRRKYTATQKESRLMKQAADEKYQSTLDNLTSEYISAREQLANADRTVELYKKQQKLALVTYQLAIHEFATGVNSITNVLDIERQLLDYKFKHSEAIATYNTVVALIENLLSKPQTE